MTRTLRAFAAAMLMAASLSAAAAAELTCEPVVANAERSKADMQVAAGTYFHGTFLGKKCVKVDYDRAFSLAKMGGRSVAPFLEILRERAANGNPSAIAALKRLGP